MAEIVAAILSILLPGVLSDVIYNIGGKVAGKYKDLINQINKVVSENNQMLLDYKNANAEKKQGILTALISSSGLGRRAASLKKAYSEAVSKEEALTKEVTEKNAAASAEANDASIKYQGAQSGVIGAVRGGIETSNLDPAAEASNYKVQDPNQNINGGLNAPKGEN